MAATDVYNTDNEKVGELELNDSLFGVTVKPHILHDVVRMQLANRRAGTASTKTRAEVRGGGQNLGDRKVRAGRGPVPADLLSGEAVGRYSDPGRGITGIGCQKRSAGLVCVWH